MMDIDRISYIFGSFSRKKSHEATAAKRRSIESPKKTHHDRSKSTPHQPKKQAVVAPRAKSVIGVQSEETKLKCPMCKRQYADPRVLPCLHTFCLKCLEELGKRDFTVWYDDDSDVSAQNTDSSGSRKVSSGGSGYVSDRQDDFSPEKNIRCPSCGIRVGIPPEGIASFPPNYPLQHRIVLAAINSTSTHLLCDICTSDVSAVARCMDCALSFCEHCEEVHLRQKSSVEHQVLSLEEARQQGITKVRKQIMCMSHPDLELTIFCSSCYQVICRDCIATSHRSHVYEPVSRAAKIHFAKLRLAAERAKTVVEESALAASKLTATSKKLEAQCCRVQGEVDKFIEEYVRSVEEHKLRLLEQIKQVREEKLQSISEEKLKLQQRMKDARDIAYFLDDLLNDGSEVEVLSFLNPVISKIEKCNFERTQDLKVSGSLQFLREEAVKCPNNFFTVYGVLTTQSVWPERCQLNIEGLQNLRVGKRVEVLLETRDIDDTPLERGGEEIIAEIHRRDAGNSRTLGVTVKDRRDGTYFISFVPDVPGKLILSVSIRGQPINGSPFPFTVRTIRQHTGTFHCCSFCSSGGSKEATCNCEGKMPGGYKGCGHGHDGHPGRRHWSCCGNILEHSECIRLNHSLYQITL
ncbi:E3 ubiquitin-protein ligase TRIM45 isoform X1 [Leptinotarsa decemlineata]|uniref:E3 ubiquitin-protein ligase TRIM45 isoform X1 n=1 Tax=Leptinotarsa decemlineata TaxID=7539 RepID=UPI003D30A547